MSQAIQIIDVNTMIGMYPTHRFDMTVERLTRDMDAYKIAAAVAVSTIGIFHDHTLGNAATAEAAKGNNRIVPAATVNPTRFFGGIEDLTALRQQGFRIARIFPVEQGWRTDSPLFDQLLTGLSAAKMPVMVDIRNPGDAADIARRAASYPAPVILGGVALENLGEVVAAVSCTPNLMIETHALWAPGVLNVLCVRVGADRVIFGSGAPRSSAAAALQYVFSSTISDDDKQKILGANIKSILEAA